MGDTAKPTARTNVSDSQGRINSFRVFQRLDFYVAIIGMVVAAIPFAFELNDTLDWYLVVFGVALAVVAIIFLIFQLVTTLIDVLERNNKQLRTGANVLSKQFEDLKQSVERLPGIVSVSHVDQFLFAKAGKARKVVNVNVGRPEAARSEVIAGVYNEFFRESASGTWTDLIGPSNIPDSRYSMIDTQDGCLEVRILKRNAPALTFIIFEISDKEKVVVFGWNGLLHNRYFASSNTDVVDFFDSYCCILEDYTWTKETDFQLKGKSARGLYGAHSDRTAPKDGWWVTEYTPFPDARSENVPMYGLIKFDFSDRSGPIFVNIFDAERKFVLQQYHSEGASYSENEVTFKWQHETPVVENGIANYVFTRRKNGPDQLSGFVLSQTTGAYGKLRGVRLIDEEITKQLDKIRLELAADSDLPPDAAHMMALEQEIVRALQKLDQFG